MPWNLDNNRPIFLQLMEKIQMDIISGKYSPGDKLPSVRDLAMDASVNPNTMQKALSELERDGLLHSQRTSGRFITDDETLISSLKEQFARREAEQFLRRIKQIGLSKEETLKTLEQVEAES